MQINPSILLPGKRDRGRDNRKLCASVLDRAAFFSLPFGVSLFWCAFPFATRGEPYSLFFYDLQRISPCLETDRAVHTHGVTCAAMRGERSGDIIYPIHYTNRRNSITWSTCHVWSAPFASAIMRKETRAKTRSTRDQISTHIHKSYTKLPEDNRI